MTNQEQVEWFQLAYEMAWFIYRNKQIAYLIALEVTYRWAVVRAQGQRTLSREQKFQRLILEVSEYFEKAIEAISVGNAEEVEEQVRRLALNMRHLESTEQSIKSIARKYLSILATKAANLEDQTMMKHYIKYLALMALRHSRVKTTVSLMQLLYRYPARETADIYEYLAEREYLGKRPDSSHDSVMDLAYYAKARRDVLADIGKRFSKFIRIEPNLAHNLAITYQITASSATVEQTEFAQGCLREFAPCDVRRSSSLPQSFRNKGEAIYQILYPEQFNVTLEEAGIPATNRPLFWPVFTNTNNTKSSGSSTQDSAPTLREREIRAALAWLHRVKRRRRQWRGTLLEIVIDGSRREYLDLSRGPHISLSLSATTSTIEVLARTEKGNILLAQWLLSEEDFDPEYGTTKYELRLESGQKITLTITPGRDGEDGTVEIHYSQISWWNKICRIITPRSFTPSPAYLRFVAIVILALCLPVFAVVLGRYSQRPIITDPSTSAPARVDEMGKQYLGRYSAPRVQVGSPGRPANGTLSGRPGQAEREREKIRLTNVRKVAIEKLGGDARLNDDFSLKLARKLSSLNRENGGKGLEVTSGEVDATLVITVEWRDAQSQILSVTVGLFEPEFGAGETWLWPFDAPHRCQYTGKFNDLVNAVAADLSDKQTEACQSHE